MSTWIITYFLEGCCYLCLGLPSSHLSTAGGQGSCILHFRFPLPCRPQIGSLLLLETLFKRINGRVSHRQAQQCFRSSLTVGLQVIAWYRKGVFTPEVRSKLAPQNLKLLLKGLIDLRVEMVQILPGLGSLKKMDI